MDAGRRLRPQRNPPREGGYVYLRLGRCGEAKADYDELFGLGVTGAHNSLGRGLKGMLYASSLATDPEIEDLTARATAALKQLR